MQRSIVGAVQMTSGPEKGRNLDAAIRLVEVAASRGAQLVVLPELFNCLADPEVIVSRSEPVPGPTSRVMSELAARLHITLLAGSIAERVEGSEKVFNSSLLFSPAGEQLARYRKIHLFDIDLPGQVTFEESRFMQAGDRIVVTQTPIGRLGQATCYDLRFPELFRRLVDAEAEVFCVPSAFTLPTGRDHWEPLLRARAIENQTYLIASNQYGRNGPGILTYGRSAIIDPWGIPLAVAGDGETVITAEIDPDHQAEIREKLPALRHRRNLDELDFDDSSADPE